jgi:DNA-binding transcriptional MocR family regulator
MDFAEIVLDKNGAMPLYRQLAEQIKTAVAEGKLSEGTKLPPIRNLASSLRVSPITVTQAYEALAAEGVAGGQVGRGTFIKAPGVRPANVSGEYSLPEENRRYNPGWQNELTTYLKNTRVGEVNRLMQSALARWNGPREDFIMLANGSPDPEFFPLGRFHKALEQAGESLAHENRQLFQYSQPLGDPVTREWLAGYLQRFGIEAQTEEILLTTGSQQAIDLIARVFLGPGEPLLVESPTYTAAIDILEQRGVNWLPIPLDHDGLQIEQLARLAERYHPKMLYCVPTAQSPTGLTLAPQRRKRLIELARQYNFLIVEDDTCNEFYYEADEPPPALKSYDEDGHVLYIKSFSKLIFPAIRIGCIVAAPFLLEKLAEAKQVFDRTTSVPLSRAVFRHAAAPAFERELKTIRVAYRERRDVFLAALERELAGTGASWTYPEAGFSLLLTLPRGLSATEVHQVAGAYGLGILPGPVFYPLLAEAQATIRLSFCDNSPARLEEAARRLSQTIRELQSRRPSGSSAANFVPAV